MKSLSFQLKILLKRIALLLLVYQLGRLAFFISNYSYFNSSSATQLIEAFLAGFRFDISAIFTLNILFILIHLIPGEWFYRRSLQLFLKILFYVVNVPSLLLNSIDMEYFKFQGKRTTADLFHLFAMGDDMKNTIPQMLKDFWYVTLIFIVLVIFLITAYNRIKIHNYHTENKGGRKYILIIPVILVLLFLGIRGGMQYKPLNIMAAARFTEPQLVPLVLNTPFTVYKTLGKDLIEEKNYFSETEALNYFNKTHHFKKDKAFRPLNVVVIILESFSSEYIGAFNNGDGYTPFLDSLMRESLVFSNSFANAKKSIDGVPAVISSIPSLMQSAYISSPYNGNRLRSLAGILKVKGYSSAFFHGGNNGTMGFDNFTLLTGFEKYYGRNEYPGDDYDGHWGVFDENFYYFFIKKCSEMRPPFVNAFFSLSSHHPYNIPAHLKGKFRKGIIPIHESIGYADYSLRCFFREAEKTAWFKNTLFVITSDHTGPPAKPYYQTKSGMFRVPIIFYQPTANLKGWTDRVTQQTSIIPGILDYLNFDEPFISFGNSMFDTTTHEFAVNYTGDMYQIIGKDHLLQFDGSDVLGMYKYKTDSFLQTNISSALNPQQQILTKTLQSYIQQYNSSLIKNDLIPIPVK